MKATATFILSAILASLVAAVPAALPLAAPGKSLNAAEPANLFKRDCNGGSCPCNLDDYSFCISHSTRLPESCLCKSACCSANNAICWPANLPHDPGDYCFGGEPGK